MAKSCLLLPVILLSLPFVILVRRVQFQRAMVIRERARVLEKEWIDRFGWRVVFLAGNQRVVFEIGDVPAPFVPGNEGALVYRAWRFVAFEIDDPLSERV